MMLFSLAYQYLYVHDPLSLINITVTKNVQFSQASAGELFALMTNRVNYGMFDFGVTNQNLMNSYKCAVMVSKSDCKKYFTTDQCNLTSATTAFTKFNQSGSLAALYEKFTVQYDNSTCDFGNTFVIVLEGRSDQAQTQIAIMVFIVLTIVIALAVICIFFVSMNEEEPDDADDDMNALLFQSPEMAVAPEAFLDDEPWESGGDDY